MQLATCTARQIKAYPRSVQKRIRFVRSLLFVIMSFNDDDVILAYFYATDHILNISINIKKYRLAEDDYAFQSFYRMVSNQSDILPFIIIDFTIVQTGFDD